MGPLCELLDDCWLAVATAEGNPESAASGAFSAIEGVEGTPAGVRAGVDAHVAAMDVGDVDRLGSRLSLSALPSAGCRMCDIV